MSDPAQAAPAGPTTREKMDAKLAEGKVKMAEGKVKATELMDKGVAMVPKPWDIKMTKVCCEEVTSTRAQMLPLVGYPQDPHCHTSVPALFV